MHGMGVVQGTYPLQIIIVKPTRGPRKNQTSTQKLCNFLVQRAKFVHNRQVQTPTNNIADAGLEMCTGLDLKYAPVWARNDIAFGCDFQPNTKSLFVNFVNVFSSTLLDRSTR